MCRIKSTLTTFLWFALAAALLMGCGAKGQPAEFEQTAGEMKPGPGAFTGEEGEFTIYDSKKGGAFWKQNQEKPQTASGAAGKETQVTPEEAKEFQEFQEWKKEQKSFKDFQEWKQSAEGKAEYQEFLEWKEWKAYQEWKKQQGQ
jgi:hypothetical protein